MKADAERATGAPDGQEAYEQLRTIRDLLRYAVSRFNSAGLSYGHGTQSALDEASFLVLEGLHLPHENVQSFLDAHLLGSEVARCLDLIEQRVLTRKPAPYLVNKAYIGGVPFYVDERVIVPRSFVAHILQSELIGGSADPLIADSRRIGRVLDLCTGSGCIAVIAALRFAGAQVDAVDLSSEALEVARRNVSQNGLEQRTRILQGDLFGPLDAQRYDLILTNPPYVSDRDMSALPREYLYEPRMALTGGLDGMDIVRRILRAAPAHLNEGGALLCEIGSGREILEREFPALRFRWLCEDACFWVQP